MPAVPIVMPSEIETVLNSTGVAPASRIACLTGSASAQVQIAWAHLDPRVGDADDRPSEVAIGEAGRAQHRPRRRAVRTGEERRARARRCR